MPSYLTPVPFKPSDLLARLKRHLDAYWCEDDNGQYTYKTSSDWTGPDNWSVSTFVTITGPDGTEHKVRLEIHEVPGQ